MPNFTLEADDIHKWVEIGKSMGWCSRVTCSPHDGPVLINDEEADEGSLEECIPIVRLLPKDL